MSYNFFSMAAGTVVRMMFAVYLPIDKVVDNLLIMLVLKF
jgi:hypothetical protein